MNRLSSMKINKLLQTWPRGTVAVHSWLNSEGISRKLAEQYRHRGWIDAIGQGAFIRRGDKVEWPGGVYAIQTASQKAIHPGGQTALDIHGLLPTLRLGARAPVYLYGAPGLRLPTWFREHKWGRPVRYSASGLFARELGLAPRTFGDFSIQVSSPERAVLEYLDGFPQTASFEEAEQLVEGLTTLRPELLQALLEACKSVKVKRMFLFLADGAKHAWRAQLQDKRIKLGHGKRSLVAEGRFDRRYQITVPLKAPESEA
jgi:hypothetical protein